MVEPKEEVMVRKNSIFLVLAALAIMSLLLSGCQLVRPEAELAAQRGVVYEVHPTGDPVQDIANIQAAIDGAQDGETILLKAGVFNFGDWKSNPIPGGFVMITKGVAVKGDGFDADGNPKTIIQGGGFRMKNHWDKGELSVIAFGGDGKGGVLDGVWLKEPHMYAVGINGLFGQNHENITIRNVKVTDISHDIPEWDQSVAIGRPIDLGGSVPEWGNGGPLGTVIIEHCDISNMGSTVELDYIDPETGKPYYRDAEGEPLASMDSQGIGLWMSTATTFIVRDNTIAMQNEGIVTEGMGGTGSILISNNDITIETVTLSKHVRHGYRLDGWVVDWAPTPFAREVRIENNRIRVVGEPEEYMYTSGMILGADNGVPGYAGKIMITNNVIEVQNGDAALAITEVQIDPLHLRAPYPLNGAEISHNHISGTARYGVLSLDSAQHCTIADNDMSALTPSVAHIGLYGENTHFNMVSGAAGVYEEAEGAHDNTVTGYTAK